MKVIRIILLFVFLGCIFIPGLHAKEWSGAVYFSDSFLIAEGNIDTLNPLLYFNEADEQPVVFFINNRFYETSLQELMMLGETIRFIGLNGDFFDTTLALIEPKAMKIRLSWGGLASLRLDTAKELEVWVRPSNFTKLRINTEKDYLLIGDKQLPIPKEMLGKENKFTSWFKLGTVRFKQGKYAISLETRKKKRLDQVVLFMVEPDAVRDMHSEVLDTIAGNPRLELGYLFTKNSSFFIPQTSSYRIFIKSKNSLNRSRANYLFKIDDKVYTFKDFFQKSKENDYVYSMRDSVALGNGFHSLENYNFEFIEWIGLEYISAAEHSSQDGVALKVQCVNPSRWEIIFDPFVSGQWLIFNQGFHPLWRAYIGTERSLAQSSGNFSALFKKSAVLNGFVRMRSMQIIPYHYSVNGYANAWHITPKVIQQLKGKARLEENGKLAIIFEYSPQRYLEWGIAVSALAVFVYICIYGNIILRSRKKRRY